MSENKPHWPEGKEMLQAGRCEYPSLCECVNWARRAVNLKYLTNHHENCPHYNASLMDVWKVTVDGVSCYVDNEQDARDTAGDEQRDDITVTQEKMHREVFEHLPEFEGF